MKTKRSDDKHFIEVLDDEGRVRIRVCIDPKGVPFGIPPKSDPCVLMYDERGRERACISLAEGGEHHVSFCDQYGRPQSYFGTYSEAESERLGNL